MDKNAKVAVVIHGNDQVIMAPHLTDAQVASNVFMCSSNVDPYKLIATYRSPDSKEQENLAYLMAMPQIGRDRILYLSQRLERSEEMLREAADKLHVLGCNFGVGSPERVCAEERVERIMTLLKMPKTVPSVEPELYKRK